MKEENDCKVKKRTGAALKNCKGVKKKENVQKRRVKTGKKRWVPYEGEDTIFIPCLLGCSAPSIVLPFLSADA